MEDDFYQEPSEFDEKVSELKEELKVSVKKEVTDEMERLRERNKYLEDRQKNITILERQLTQKLSEAKYAISNAKREAMKARFKEISNMFSSTFWTIGFTSNKRPKCDNCDKNRKVHATSDSGQKLEASCLCDRYEHIYSAYEVQLLKIYDNDSNWRYIKYHKDDYGDAQFSDNSKKMYDGRDFEKVEKYSYPLFENKETADRYAEYLTSENSK